MTLRSRFAGVLVLLLTSIAARVAEEGSSYGNLGEVQQQTSRCAVMPRGRPEYEEDAEDVIAVLQLQARLDIPEADKSASVHSRALLAAKSDFRPASHGSRMQQRASAGGELTQQEAHVAQLLQASTRSAAESIGQLQQLHKVQVLARTQLQQARTENARMQATLAKMRSRRKWLQHELALKKKRFEDPGPTVITKANHFLHSVAFLSIIVSMVALVLVCVLTAIGRRLWQYSQRGRGAQSLRKLLTEQFTSPISLIGVQRGYLSPRAQVGLLVLIAFWVLGFWLMWQEGIIQPFLKQVTTFMWIAIAAIFLLVVILYEISLHAARVWVQFQEGLAGQSGGSTPGDSKEVKGNRGRGNAEKMRRALGTAASLSAKD